MFYAGKKICHGFIENVGCRIMGGFNQNQAFSPITLAGDDRNVSGDPGYGNLKIEPIKVAPVIRSIRPVALSV